jgi:hypothetical protein
MQAFVRMVPRAGLLATLGLVFGCGGGGAGGNSTSGPTITAPPHATATLALTAVAAPEIAAQATAVLSSLRSLGFQLVVDLESVSPAVPTNQTACAGGGTWTYTYVDVDKSGTRTVGDQILIAAPGCSIAPFGNGSATATVLATDSTGLVDVRIVINGGTLPYMAAWNWVPAIQGTLRMTADDSDLWLRSEGDIVFTPDATKVFRASNLGLRLAYDVTNNPPTPGIFGSMDIAFGTPLGRGSSVALDTDGLVAGHAPNVAPRPGAILLRGLGNSEMRIADATPTSPGWYLVATDANGDGVVEATTTISSNNFYDAL